MKRVRFIGTAVLGSILGIAASVSAQQQEDREKPAAPPPAAHEDQATPPEQVNPADEKRQQEAKPSQEEKRARQDDKKVQQEPKQEQDKKVQQEPKQEQKDNKQAQEQQKRQQKDEQRAQKEDKNNPQARAMQDAHRGGGQAGARIPDDKFRAHFGREHHFRVSRPTVVSGQPRFEYSGYSFVIVDSWPAGWDYADDCYIDYVDGEYLLFDLMHPGMSIVVTVVL
jgi:hypothetical protein